MKPLIVGASVAISWCLGDERDALASALLAMVPDCLFVVPQHWSLEVANGLHIAHRKGRIDETQLAEAISLLDNLALDVDSDTFAAALKATLAQSDRWGITAYDAAYLELALRLSLPLATLDIELAKAAKGAVVEVVEKLGD